MNRLRAQAQAQEATTIRQLEALTTNNCPAYSYTEIQVEEANWVLDS